VQPLLFPATFRKFETFGKFRKPKHPIFAGRKPMDAHRFIAFTQYVWGMVGITLSLHRSITYHSIALSLHK